MHRTLQADCPDSLYSLFEQNRGPYRLYVVAELIKYAVSEVHCFRIEPPSWVSEICFKQAFSRHNPPIVVVLPLSIRQQLFQSLPVVLCIDLWP